MVTTNSSELYTGEQLQFVSGVFKLKNIFSQQNYQGFFYSYLFSSCFS